MDLTILGSSAAIPVKNRNLSATALNYRSDIILFDCGEDLQRRFIDAGLKFNKSLIVLISHFHGDHIIGLPGLLFRFSLIDRTKPVHIIGPRNIFIYLFMHSVILGLRADYPLFVYEIDHENKQIIKYDGLTSTTPSERKKIDENVVFRKKRYQIKYTKVEHSVNTFGYSFIEEPRYGKFHPERARELGIPEGKLWKTLQKGESIRFNGKEIDPVKERIVDPKRTGRKVTYSGDTGPCDSLIRLGKNSDVLIHESTFSKKLKDLAREKQHSTSVDAANVAKAMNAKKLILTHISSRYQDEVNNLLKDAQEIFPNTILAEDLLTIKVK